MKQDLINLSSDFGNKFKLHTRFGKSPDESPNGKSPVSKRGRFTGGTSMSQSGTFTNEVKSISLNSPEDLAQRIKKLYNFSML